MDLRNIPYRSEVALWAPDHLADYFRRLNFKDCEKVVKKNRVTGQRFLNLSENDIQKFPKTRIPFLSKLSQDINRNEERKSFFPKRTPTQRVLEKTPECRQDEADGWSSFDESDEYVSPDEQDPENDVDYETPNEDGSMEDVNDADYEPPPSNDDMHRHTIFPSKSIPNTSEYLDRPLTAKTSLQPPIPPQRPGSSPILAGRDTGQPTFFSHSSNESNREKSSNSFKPPIDRNKKPNHLSGSAFDRDILVAGKRGFPDMSLTPQLRTLGEKLAEIKKPPVPPANTYERNNPTSKRKPQPIRNCHGSDQKTEVEDDNGPQRPVPQPPMQFFNTFPSTKPQFKQSSLPPKGTPDAYTESTVSSSGSLPPRLQSSNVCRAFYKSPAEGRPPLPIPSKQMTKSPNFEKEETQENYKANLNPEWYAANITRSEAEVALRTINKDGTFLVRDSSRKTLEQPYVLMVLCKNKVYNIQIYYQQEDEAYVLGTGLKVNEDFTSVADIINYYGRMPLRLIDGKDRCSRKQTECTLAYAAGSF